MAGTLRIVTDFFFIEAGKQISPFSLNERLLLSGVFHVHFDTFLKKLEDILPPGYKPPKSKSLKSLAASSHSIYFSERLVKPTVSEYSNSNSNIISENS